MRLVYSFIALVGLYACYSLYSYVTELQKFKQSVIEQTQVLQAQAQAQTYELFNAFTTAHTQGELDISRINGSYSQLLNERLQLTSAPAGKTVPAAAAPTSSHGQAQASQSSTASAALSSKLLKCEARLLHEAKEYDILATHYNVLLRTYEQARILNADTKERK